MNVTLLNNKEVDLNVFDFKMAVWNGKQETFTDAGIKYNLNIWTSAPSSIAIVLFKDPFKVKTLTSTLVDQAKAIFSNISGDVRVAFTNKSAQGRLGNTAVPFTKSYGSQTTPAKSMLIGVHLLNPEVDTYYKEVKLPDNCQLVSTTWDDNFAPIDKSKCFAKQEGNTLIINCVKVKCSESDFNRLVPLYLEFDFNTTGQEPVTDFGPGYYKCEIPEIFGAYWRKKA